MQAAKRQLKVFGATVVTMVKAACSEAIDSLEVNMTATLGRTSKLVNSIMHSKSLSKRTEGTSGQTDACVLELCSIPGLCRRPNGND